MKEAVKYYTDLEEVLKNLRYQITHPEELWSGREPENVNLRPREILVNWMLCAALNYEFDEQRFTISTDPDPAGGDGIILDRKTRIGELRTEHRLIRPDPQGKNLDVLIEEAIAEKMKKGIPYAKGKTLVLFTEGNGEWKPNKVARQIIGKHSFYQVWVVGIRGVFKGKYSYEVCLLDASQGDAPVWLIRLQRYFKSWRVKRRQPTSGGLTKLIWPHID